MSTLTSLLWRPRWPDRPVPAYLLLRGGSDLLFTLTLVYQATVVGPSPLHLVLVGTLLGAVCAVFETPTGIVADGYSRRLSILIGLFLVGSGFVVEGAIPSFAAVLACQVLRGIGATFLSGAVEAWIADEIGEEAVGTVFPRGTQVGHIGTMLGIGGAVALGWHTVQVLVLAGGVGFLALGSVMTLIMPECGFARRSGPNVEGRFAAMATTFREGVVLARRRPVVGRLCAVSLVAGLASEGFDRLWAVRAAWMNRHLEPRVRATVLSIESQCKTFGQIAGGPPLGAIGSRVSVRGRS